jgi:DNA-binding FadR family transcriptional regulator
VKYEDRAHMATVIAQHRAIIAAMRGTSQQAYIDATREHLPASAEAYRLLHTRRFGNARASR